MTFDEFKARVESLGEKIVRFASENEDDPAIVTAALVLLAPCADETLNNMIEEHKRRN